MDMLVNVDINDGVRATLNLTEGGNSRVELVGGGTLSFAMNPQGDSRFTGRYALSGGTVVYTLPVVPRKVFRINAGSYVEWSGDISDPLFNINATDAVQTVVEGEGQLRRTVDFNIIIAIRNTMQNMEITFDLAAPNDPEINNRLLGLAPEQRSTQALELLVFNRYTGPGTTSRIDFGNPLNSLIESELNRWARSALPGVDMNFGLQTVADARTGGEHTDFSYSVSHNFFNDRVRITVGGRVSTDATSQDLTDDIMSDISVEYRLAARDNMFVRLFRNNTRPSILEGEVVETGVGFVMRRRLNRLGDLFRFTAGPERQRIRAERRENKEQTDEE
jgi:hypothetical protein